MKKLSDEVFSFLFGLQKPPQEAKKPDTSPENPNESEKNEEAIAFDAEKADKTAEITDETALTALKTENSELKKQIKELQNLEEKRSAELVIEELRRKYADFDPELIGAQIRTLAETLAERYEEDGYPPAEARKAADAQTRFIWDTPRGLEDLYLLHKARTVAEFGQILNRQRAPDGHIRGSAAVIPPRSWKERMESSVQAERDSVFNELL